MILKLWKIQDDPDALRSYLAEICDAWADSTISSEEFDKCYDLCIYYMERCQLNAKAKEINSKYGIYV